VINFALYPGFFAICPQVCHLGTMKIALLLGKGNGYEARFVRGQKVRSSS